MKLPPINHELMKPCYEDLMPTVSQTDNLQKILIADAETFEAVQRCYLRQHNLILEIKRRDMD